MNQLIRRLLFFFFLIVFLISAPVIVLYTAGFRYNLQSGTFIRTGVLSISTEPRNAQIIFDGRDIDRQTPAVIKQLMPGHYDLSLIKTGYHEWFNDITIESGVTTHLPAILLFADKDPVNLWTQTASQLTPSPDGARVVYVLTQGGWDEIWLNDLQLSERKMIARLPNNDHSTTISWSQDGGYLLVYSQDSEAFSVYNQNGNTLTWPEFQAEKIEKVYWHPGVDHQLFVQTTDLSLQQIDFLNNTATTLTAAGQSTITLDASQVYFATRDGQTELRQVIGEQEKVVALLPQGEYTITKRDGQYLIVRSSRGELLLIDIHATEPILFKQMAVLDDYSAQSHLLLWSDGNEINIYNPATHQTEFITRQGDPISQISWLPDEQHLLLASQNKIWALDRYKNGAQRYAVALLSTDQLETFWITENGEEIYIYGKVVDQVGLFQLTIK